MALHPSFPTSPYAPLIPEQRWFPADEALRVTAYEKLLPPLVAKVRQEADPVLPPNGSEGSNWRDDFQLTLKQWCADATAAEEDGQQYGLVFVNQTSFEKHAPKTFAALTTTFTAYDYASLGFKF